MRNAASGGVGGGGKRKFGEKTGSNNSVVLSLSGCVCPDYCFLNSVRATTLSFEA